MTYSSKCLCDCLALFGFGQPGAQHQQQGIQGIGEGQGQVALKLLTVLHTRHLNDFQSTTGPPVHSVAQVTVHSHPIDTSTTHYIGRHM